jgi:hypothetical protein
MNKSDLKRITRAPWGRLRRKDTELQRTERALRSMRGMRGLLTRPIGQDEERDAWIREVWVAAERQGR